MIYILYNKTEVFDYILSGINNQNEIRLINLNEECSYFQRFLRKILPPSLVLSSLILGRKLRKTLKNINDKDSLLLIDYTDENIILSIDQLIDQKINKYIWIWNPLKSNEIQKVESKMKFLKIKEYMVCTFDKNDALQYNLKLLNQFYKMTQSEKVVNSSVYDFYFLGFAKDRIKEINDLQNKLSKFRTLFHVVVDSKDLVTYSENIENVKKSKCIVDIVQKDQEGMSLRPLEAVAFKKKLITNNKSLVNEKIYNSQNIFIIGIDDFSILNSFLNSDYVELKEQFIYKHDVNTWLSNFRNLKD
ncbi:hypothetical protein FLGE108171_07920 [Flavobacterium gelidilacus]|uniref:hypothetical protein n=1 Tax=Flavobacterium gelidilacus TaxID=206041 RepID=UPI00041E69F7|nr:hypothetical protein [Flavobacterium gelidilacus]